jgi:hypothetical protein
MASRRFLVVVSGAKIYAAANPLRSDRRNRTKDSIATVRHLNLDFDIDGEARLTSVRTSRCWWSAAAPRLPLRGVSEKVTSNDAVEPPAKKLTAGVESAASVRVLKA